MPTKYHKLIPVSLGGDEYDGLARLAAAEERDPIQQVRWLIREAVRTGDANRTKLMTAREDRGDDLDTFARELAAHKGQ